uniref:MD-2-related lipid-recognition domain-containing protein n=1 Tax=viral metagenome TaxID=1070528 RepID=A0A6C0K829_9ZZZZ
MLALLLAYLVPTVLASVSDCSSGTSLLQLTSLSFSPDPTVPGQNSTLLLSMKVPEEITNGTTTYSTTYNFIPLKPTTDDLCDTVVCPIIPGSLDTRSSYPIDKTLSGSMTLKIEWKDLTGRQLLCVSVKTKLGDAAKQVALRNRQPKLRLRHNHKKHKKHPMCPNNWYNASLHMNNTR